MTQITIKHGSAINKSWSCRVFINLLDLKSEGQGGTVRLNTKMSTINNQGVTHTNQNNPANGSWYGGIYEAENGHIVLVKALQNFMKAQSAMSVLPIRIRDDGPMLVVKGVFPTMQEFPGGDSVMLFSGRGDILTKKNLDTLGYKSCLHPNDWRNGFDAEEEDECFNVVTFTDVIGYAPRPDFVVIKERGVIVGAKAVPQMRQRRIRIHAKPDEPEEARRTRRVRKR